MLQNKTKTIKETYSQTSGNEEKLSWTLSLRHLFLYSWIFLMSSSSFKGREANREY